MSENIKKRMFSGVQPSGTMTLGNYLGTLKYWKDLQNDHECIFSIVDMHAITVQQVPATLRKNSLELLALFIACGVDPEKTTLFIQSHVSAHAELSWVLNTMTYYGELSRMTQFKDKSSKLENSSINMGLMDYPVLMASDILLYNADLVPIGADQKQHLELTRDIGARFNSRYSDTFTIPEPYIPKTCARVMSLADPDKKMSKSDSNVNGFISLADDKDTIIRKFKKAVTDSDCKIIHSPDKKGISNLIDIYGNVLNISVAEVEKRFASSSYGEFKEEVGVAVAEVVAPIKNKQEELIKDKKYLESVMKDGAEKANAMARKTLRKVYKKIGFIN